jgi:phosphohistidine phosphatase
VILYFLRHAHAEPAGREGSDAARRLSTRGEAAMRAAAPVWRRLNLRPDVVLSSPLPRALRTAELFVEGVMFVGHEPDLSETVSLLTGASSVRMRKGGLACVEFPGYPDAGQGELAWLLDPDLYESDER